MPRLLPPTYMSSATPDLIIDVLKDMEASLNLQSWADAIKHPKRITLSKKTLRSIKNYSFDFFGLYNTSPGESNTFQITNSYMTNFLLQKILGAYNGLSHLQTCFCYIYF